MVQATTFALAGLQAASTRVSVRAQNIANVQTPNYQPAVPVQTSTAVGPVVTIERQSGSVPGNTTSPGNLAPDLNFPVSSVQLESEISDLAISKNAYKAAALVLRTANEITEETLDLLG